MQLVDHVVMTTYKRSIRPSRLDNRQLEGPFQEPPSVAVANEARIAVCEPHRERAAGDVVGAQLAVELRVEATDSLVGVRATRSSANRVDLPRRVRTIVQVHDGEAEVRPMNYG